MTEEIPHVPHHHLPNVSPALADYAVGLAFENNALLDDIRNRKYNGEAAFDARSKFHANNVRIGNVTHVDKNTGIASSKTISKRVTQNEMSGQDPLTTQEFGASLRSVVSYIKSEADRDTDSERKEKLTTIAREVGRVEDARHRRAQLSDKNLAAPDSVGGYLAYHVLKDEYAVERYGDPGTIFTSDPRDADWFTSRAGLDNFRYDLKALEAFEAVTTDPEAARAMAMNDPESLVALTNKLIQSYQLVLPDEARLEEIAELYNRAK